MAAPRQKATGSWSLVTLDPPAVSGIAGIGATAVQGFPGARAFLDPVTRDVW